jgi:hypothetical protein
MFIIQILFIIPEAAHFQMDINIILQLIPLILVLYYPLQDQFVASIMYELWFE